MLPGRMSKRMTMETKELHSGVCDLEQACQNNHGLQEQSMKKQPCSIPETYRNMAVDWMGFFHDDTPITMLTIPGTHDSAAFTKSFPFVATQKMDFLDQLNAGIRYFDLRCAIRDDVVEMVHGVTYLGLTLKTVLNTMYVWLQMNPSEALIVQVKRDREAQRSTVEFSKALSAIIAQKPERWRTASTVPLLGALRGRIQLFRRFEGSGLQGYGLNVTDWKDNPQQPFTIQARHGVQVTIQDHYTFPKPQPLPEVIKKKGSVVLKLLNRASSERDENHWFINFTSAYELNLRYQLTPREIAIGGWHLFQWEDGMNVRLRASLLEMRGKKRRLGIVVMDFPESGVDDLIAALIQSNFDLEDRRFWKRSIGWLLLLLLSVFLLAAFWSVISIENLLENWTINLGRLLERVLTAVRSP